MTGAVTGWDQTGEWEQTEPVRIVGLDAVANDTLHFCAPAQLLLLLLYIS